MQRKSTTIGMLTYDDHQGVWSTIQDIRLHQPEVMDEVEFLVLDNHLDSPHGAENRKFMRWIKEPARYIGIDNITGTALRDYLFRLAETPYVICLDSHVDLVSGSLRKTIDYMDSGLDHGNLLQGPLLYDSMESISHFSNVWRSGMLGIWAQAWKCPCGYIFQTAESDEKGQKWLTFETMTVPHVRIAVCGRCERLLPPDMAWSGHEAILAQNSFVKAIDETRPFEIPSQGLGLFCCRRDSWLGFNPEFRQFGGEEGYIHEKYRQAGRTTMCLPWLRWLHRFGRPDGIRYPINWSQRIRNYLIGHRELGWDTAPMLEHFRGLLGREAVDAALSP